MLNADAADGFVGLLEWSEPVIFDRLLEAYRGKLGGGAPTWKIARTHSRLFRALMRGDSAAFDDLWRELWDGLNASNLGPHDLAAADDAALRELLDVVLSRFRHGDALTMSYHLALIDLATRMQHLERRAP